MHSVSAIRVRFSSYAFRFMFVETHRCLDRRGPVGLLAMPAISVPVGGPVPESPRTALLGKSWQARPSSSPTTHLLKPHHCPAPSHRAAPKFANHPDAPNSPRPQPPPTVQGSRVSPRGPHVTADAPAASHLRFSPRAPPRLSPRASRAAALAALRTKLDGSRHASWWSHVVPPRAVLCSLLVWFSAWFHFSLRCVDRNVASSRCSCFPRVAWMGLLRRHVSLLCLDEKL